MSARYLLDTNVLSETMRHRPNETVRRRLAEHEALLVTAAPVVHELSYGIEKVRDVTRRRQLQRLERAARAELPVLPYDEKAARWHAEERACLEQVLGTRPFVDGQIAAIAAVNGCVLVTRNVKDFEGYAGVVVEDWFGA